MGLNKFFNDIEADIDYNHIKQDFQKKINILEDLITSDKDLEKIKYIKLFLEEVDFFQLKNNEPKQNILKENLKWCNKKYKEYLASPK